MHHQFRRTRVRLTLTYVLAFAVLAGLAGVGFWIAFAHFEYAAVDQGITAQGHTIFGGLNVGNGQVNFSGESPLPGQTKHGIAITALLVNSAGTILDRSGNNSNVGSLVSATSHGVPRGVPFNLVTGHHTDRVLVLPVAGSGARLVLAQPIDELQKTLLLAAILLVTIVAALIVANALLGYWVAGRALRPVRVMAATVRDISEHDLGRRLQIALPPGDELGELGATFDAMLTRLEAAFDGLRRFTADAAHELRAPLTLMRSQLEVTLRRERTPDEYRASHRILLQEIDRLSRTAEQLLLLARADAGSLVARKLTIDAGDFVDEVVGRWQLAAKQHGIRMLTDVRSEDAVEGDPDLLRRCLDNLLDNAVRHTPPGGHILVLTDAEGPWWTLTVDDTGPGVDPAIRPRLFQRFTRADRARSPEAAGAGLGLSLCQAIAAAHGGGVTLATSVRGARFVVRLPVGPGNAAA
ncbi:MAG: ATP-binding protein [Candidatus Dormibacteria bacterium]